MTEHALAVEALGVSKRFQRHLDRRNTLKERIVRGRSRRTEDFWAVRDVTLQVPEGSVYGLIGHNGSGKSTLLKMIGGIYRATTGTIRTQGRVASLIELGAGFHPDMTGRENISLNGSILGLSRKEIAAVTDEIIEFSGLTDFINEPVKHYSSGMYVRLGFSVAVHMKPDVLLVDEVLSVGDEEFQRRCFDHLSGLRRAGKTIVVVSHGLGQLEAICDDVTWLDHGTVQRSGSAPDVIAAYLQRVNAEEAARNPMLLAHREGLDDSRGGDGDIRARSASIVSTSGEPLNHAETGTTFAVRVAFTAYEPILGPNVRIALQHETGPLVTMLSNHRIGHDLGVVEGGAVIDLQLLNNPLLPGRYRVHIDIFDHTGIRLLDSWNEALDFAVRSQRGEINQGFVELPVSVTFTPTPDAS